MFFQRPDASLFRFFLCLRLTQKRLSYAPPLFACHTQTRRTESNRSCVQPQPTPFMKNDRSVDNSRMCAEAVCVRYCRPICSALLLTLPPPRPPDERSGTVPLTGDMSKHNRSSQSQRGNTTPQKEARSGVSRALFALTFARTSPRPPAGYQPCKCTTAYNPTPPGFERQSNLVFSCQDFCRSGKI